MISKIAATPPHQPLIPADPGAPAMSFVDRNRPDYAGKLFGAVKIPKHVGPHLIAGNPVGEATGYASLNDALAGLGKLTSGTTPAAAIFENSGRFFGQAALTTLGGQLDAAHVTPNYQKQFTIKLGSNVAAMVDGDVRLVNDGSIPKWNTIARLYFQMVANSWRGHEPRF